LSVDPDTTDALASALAPSATAAYLREENILGYQNLRSLRTLAIGETKTKALDLSFLSDFENLKSLRTPATRVGSPFSGACGR
jgi:hypothetical protein